MLRDVIADSTAQHGIAGLERVEDGALCYRTRDFEFDLVADLRQQPQMLGENNADHRATLEARDDLCETAIPIPETTVRILNILSGVAVLFTTLALGHLLHHYFLNASTGDLHSPAFLASFAAAVAVEIFSVIGACLLIRRGR